LKLACSTLIFGILKDEDQFRETLSAIRRTGYTGVQIEFDLLPEELRNDPGSSRKIIESSGLIPVAVAVTFDESIGRFMKAIGSKIGTLCLFEPDYDSAVEKTRSLARFYASLDLDLSLQPHVRSNLQNPEQLDEILQRCAPLHPSICFDTAHLTALGIELRAFIHRYSDRISIVHLKDLKKDHKYEIDYARDFVDVGEGTVDFRSVFDGFEKAGYEGWFVIEVDHAHDETISESIEKNFQRVSALLS
jgi:sugar phosphate isomerase/epimerase